MGTLSQIRTLLTWGRVRQWAAWTCVVPVLCAHVTAQGADAPLEYQVKAAYLLNFTKFVEWPPASAETPLEICILGKDPFGHALDQIVEGETVGSQKVTVERIAQLPAPPSCKVIFVGDGEKDVPKILSAVAPGVLTVGDGDRFIKEGGMIGFVLVDRRVRFDINSKAAAGAGVKLSSRLMRVARAIEK